MIYFSEADSSNCKGGGHHGGWSKSKKIIIGLITGIGAFCTVAIIRWYIGVIIGNG